MNKILKIVLVIVVIGVIVYFVMKMQPANIKKNLIDDIYQKWVDIAEKNSMVIPKELGKVVVEKPTHNKADSVAIEIVTKERKRSEVYDTVAEMNRYTDGKMKYEMERLKGHE